MTVSELGPNDCTTTSISGRDILVVAEGQTEVNVGDSGCYINQQSDGQEIGLYEVDGPGGGYDEVATVAGGPDEWFAGFDVDWENGETPQGSFSDNKLVVNATSTGYPSPVFASTDAYDVLDGDTSEMDRVLNASIQDDIDDQYCLGQEDSVTIYVNNDSICRSIEATVNITNELTGETNSVNVTNDFTETNDLRRLNGKDVEISFTIPDDAPLGQQDILSVDVTSDNAVNDPPSFTFSTFIGPKAENLSLQPISDISGVCPGDGLDPDVVAVNSGSCPANLGVEITNDYNDTVISEDATSVSTGEASDGTNSYFVSADVPDQSGISSITYTVDLVLVGPTSSSVVDTETFTASVSEPQLSITNINSEGQVCAGDEVEVSIVAQNNGACDTNVTAELSNNLNSDTMSTAPENIYGGSDSDIDFDYAVPDSAAGQGSITFTIDLLDSGGTVVDTATTEVGIGSTDISLRNLEFPNSVCAGKTVEGEVEATNNGDCPSTVTIDVTRQSTGVTQQAGTVSIDGGDDDDVDFDIDIPTGAAEIGQDTFIVSAVVQTADGESAVDTLQATADINTSSIQLNNVNAPDRVCAGRDVSISFGIENTGQCDGEYRVRVTDSINNNTTVIGSEEIGAQRVTDVEFEEPMPPAAVPEGQASYSYEVESLLGGQFTTVTAGSVTVNTDTSDINIQSVEGPSEKCIGTSASFVFNIENAGSCDTEYRAVVSVSPTGEEIVVDNEEIGGDVTKEILFDHEIGSEFSNASQASYSLTIEKRPSQDQEWSSAAQSSWTVEVLKPDVNVESTTYPEYARPGSKEYTVTVLNSGECATNVTVDISGNTDSVEVGSGESVELTDSFVLLSNMDTREISIDDSVLQREVDTFSHTVNPHKFIHMSQSEGVVELIGGFGQDVRYTGTIVGSGITAGDNLEEEDNVVGPLSAKSFRGTALPDSDDKDTIRFSSVKGLNIQATESMVIVADGEVKGTSNSYRHTTALSSTLGLADGEADIETRSGPLSSVGSVRRRMGITPSILSGPILTVDK